MYLHSTFDKKGLQLCLAYFKNLVLRLRTFLAVLQTKDGKQRWKERILLQRLFKRKTKYPIEGKLIHINHPGRDESTK